MNPELYKPFKLCLSIFKVFGMWQDGEQTWTYTIMGFAFYFFCLGSETFGIFMFAIRSENLLEFTGAFGLFVTNLADITKSINLFLRIKFIKKSMENLENLLEFSADERFKSRSYIKVQVVRCQKVFKALLFSAIASCTAAILTPVLHHELPYKIWHPFGDSETSFWIVSSVLVANSYYIACSDMALAIFPVIFMCFAIGITQELSERLSEICKPRDGQEKRRLAVKAKEQHDELVKCVKIHLKLKDLVQEISDNFSFSILSQALMSSSILCISAFNLSTAEDINSVLNFAVFMIPMTLEIFLPCYFGNELMIASKNLSNSLFQSNWYQGDEKLRTSVKFFMENSSKDITVSAFTVFNANLATFGRIVNSAYSLFAVLKRLSV